MRHNKYPDVPAFIGTDDGLVHSQQSGYGTNHCTDCEEEEYDRTEKFIYLHTRCTLLAGTDHLVTCLSCLSMTSRPHI
jgi:hypothetical protein